MADPEVTIRSVQIALEPYIKSREQVNYIRRILAAQLAQGCGGQLLKHPLSIIRNWGDVERSNAYLTGASKDYQDALKENLAARRRLDEMGVIQQKSSVMSARQSHNFVEERVSLLKSIQKRDRLYAIQGSLDLLSEKPAAEGGYMDTDNVFRETASLPRIPKAILQTIATEQSTSPVDVQSRLTQLEKVFLRAKFALKMEEQLLQQARDRSQKAQRAGANASKVEALNATRDELIRWIETELGKASGDDQIEIEEDGPVDFRNVSQQLTDAHEKYAKYVAARRLLLDMVAGVSGSVDFPSEQKTVRSKFKGEPPVPTPTPPADHLVLPYIEALLDASNAQKASITQKSHLLSTIGKENKQANKRLVELAHMSKLLRSYTNDGGRVSTAEDEDESNPASSHPGLSRQVKPWILSADIAKIRNLEAVAENIERGQVALEISMMHLQQLQQMTGRQGIDGDDVDYSEEPSETELWLQSNTPGRRQHAKKPADVRLPRSYKRNDMWSKLHGNLGLLGHDGT